MCGQNCQMRRIWSYFWHQTVFPCSFPGTSVLFLYRNVKETVVSFQRVMAAFTTLARFFTNDQVIYFPKRQERWQLSLQEMNQWWVDDLPLPLPHTTYRWARDQDMLVRNPTRDEEGWKLNRIHTGPAEHACSNGPQLLLHSRLCTRLHQAGPQHLLPGLQVLHIIFICYNFSRDLVARPEEAWASLASYCGLDPTNAKPLEAHKKLVSVDVFDNF